MDSTKKWWQSTAVWGGVITLAGVGVGVLGYTFTPADQAEAVTHVSAVAAGVGGLLAIIGRIRASKKIG